ncbi:ABC transporter permease [Thermodesulforhabdus norvegica]|uniref:FtsX-like permease family protein n=1 Tax=Thermodesulforhabdus norvegica TaxID=39841 RepID=A0A1I4T7Y9_9BACT|nr:FtsX-like permease family protein [Thermodesulforhabdus norvegica]SFM72842.1 FtsX-like permease family protein [Thermodesulforhabdus norvegica]
MKEIDKGTVKKQIVLPWKHVMRIAWTFMIERWSRSVITVASLMLAVSFLAYTFFTFEILNSLWPFADPATQQKIIRAGYLMENGRFGAHPRDIWLAILAMLISLVGITNTQLMAVTERFREIGTMKCLGALDSFVVKIFMLEAIYQGLMGSLAGWLLGTILATLTALAKIGLICLLYFPAGGLGKILILTVTLTVFLSILGVSYPCIVAARMQPAVALRQEE